MATMSLVNSEEKASREAVEREEVHCLSIPRCLRHSDRNELILDACGLATLLQESVRAIFFNSGCDFSDDANLERGFLRAFDLLQDKLDILSGFRSWPTSTPCNNSQGLGEYLSKMEYHREACHEANR